MPTRPETIDNILNYFPLSSKEMVRNLFSQHPFSFTVTKANKTKLGSFKAGQPGTRPTIYINYDLGKFTFLLIFLHELAHYMVWSKYKQKVSPHGIEWKHEFQQLAIPFMQQSIFPAELVIELKKYFLTTPATLHHSINLVKTLNLLDGKKVSPTVSEIPINASFKLSSGKEFIKLEKRRTRYKCYCPADKKYYLVSKSAQIIQP